MIIVIPISTVVEVPAARFEPDVLIINENNYRTSIPEGALRTG